jgi:hypothetical protein
MIDGLMAYDLNVATHLTLVKEGQDARVRRSSLLYMQYTQGRKRVSRTILGLELAPPIQRQQVAENEAQAREQSQMTAITTKTECSRRADCCDDDYAL